MNKRIKRLIDAAEKVLEQLDFCVDPTPASRMRLKLAILEVKEDLEKCEETCGRRPQLPGGE